MPQRKYNKTKIEFPFLLRAQSKPTLKSTNPQIEASTMVSRRRRQRHDSTWPDLIRLSRDRRHLSLRINITRRRPAGI